MVKRHPARGGTVKRLTACVLATAAAVQLLSFWATSFPAAATVKPEESDLGSSQRALAAASMQLPSTPAVPRKTVAYAVSVTKDGSYVDGAAVLAHSAIRVHRHGASKYGVDLVAFVAPAVSDKGRRDLAALGYRVLERLLPVEVEDIRGEYLRSRIGSNGCCGAWELLKLYSWTLLEYHRVVHMDMDALILQNIDELFDDDSPLWADGAGALYTYDWTMAQAPWGRNPPVQGGFVVARPLMATYEALVEVVREGDFRAGGGWGGTGAGKYWGGMTIQGLLPYFFEKYRPGTGHALDTSVYNNMVTNPRSVGGFGKGECRDGTKAPAECKDPRLVDVETIKTTHFTICQKPWTCTSASSKSCPYCPLCAKLHARWFAIRREMELEWGTYSALTYTGKAPERAGMCKGGGEHSYLPVPIAALERNASAQQAWISSWRTPQLHPHSPS